MNVQYDDQTLIKGCLQNDRNSQKLLYEKYSPAMLGHCMRFTNSREMAEDVLIEGFMRVYKNLGSYQGNSSLAFWIKRVMTNAAISYLRKNSKHHNLVSIDENEFYEPEDKTIYINEKQSEKELLELIQKMPEKYRTVLNLRAFEGLEYGEIASMLDIPEVTARTRFSKAKKWLEERIDLKS